MRCFLGACTASARAAVQGTALKPSARFPGLAGLCLEKDPPKRTVPLPAKTQREQGSCARGRLSKACPGTPSSSSGACAWSPPAWRLSAGGLEEGEKSPSTACKGQEHPTTAPPVPGTLQVPERGVLLLGLGLHGLLGRLAHREGEGAMDVLGVAQLVQVLPEDLGTLHSHLIIEGNLQQLRGRAEGRLRGVTACLAPLGQGRAAELHRPFPQLRSCSAVTTMGTGQVGGCPVCPLCQLLGAIHGPPGAALRVCAAPRMSPERGDRREGAGSTLYVVLSSPGCSVSMSLRDVQCSVVTPLLTPLPAGFLPF